MWMEWGEVGSGEGGGGAVWRSLMNPLALPFLRMWPRLTHQQQQQQPITD